MDIGKGAAGISLALAAIRSGAQAAMLNIRDFGATGDGLVDDSRALQEAIAAAAGQPVLLPSGRYRLAFVSAASAYLVGEGASESRIELHTDGTESILDIADLIVEDIGFSDRGRSAMDHRKSPNVVLFRCSVGFQARRCLFSTNRGVLLQSPAANARSTIVVDCRVERVTTPRSDEEDRSNIFICNSGAPLIHFEGLQARGLAARSVINATYPADSPQNRTSIVATVDNCLFEYIHNVGGNKEVKVVFLQGFTADVTNNIFIDCFGRHIDLLGNYDRGSSRSVYRHNCAKGNVIQYTKERASASGSGNDEAGSIYCRYADVTITGNRLDFRNLRLSSSAFSAISVRHGYRNATIEANEIIGAKAHAISADISDAIDTDHCAVSIAGNTVSSVRASRKPIAVANNSQTKMFSKIEIMHNVIDYRFNATGILLARGAVHLSSFTTNLARIAGNANGTTPSIDSVDLNGLPLTLEAPQASINIDERLVPRDPGRRAELMSRVAAYNCKSLRFVALP